MMKFCISLVAVITLFSCTRNSSPTTGWDYNSPENGGFQKVPWSEQETGPGLVLIQGGTFEMYLEQDSILSEKTMEVIVPSYYLDEKEVSNQAYCEYLYWTNRTFGIDFPLIHENALPDTLVWEKEMGRGENFVSNYLRHPAYSNYPVVGVSWMQANNYCEWRTDRVNEMILIREGILLHNPNQINEDHFNTEAYLVGQYYSGMRSEGQLKDLNPMRASGSKSKDLGSRIVRLEDGILLPHYRLPTEVEWEYAASAGVTIDKKLNKKLDQSLIHFGQFINPLYKGDDSFNTYSVMPVDAFIPNDFGIYNLSGNVSEWVADTYTVRSDTTVNSYSPYYGRKAKISIESIDYKYDEKLNVPVYDLEQFEFFIGELEKKYNQQKLSDSLSGLVFQEVKKHIKRAKDYEKEEKYLDASMVMIQMENGLFDEMNQMYNQISEFGYKEELSLIVDVKHYLAKSILDVPGNIKYEDVSPIDRIKYRNNDSKNYPYYDSIISSNHERVYKGANWLDLEKWITPSFRRHQNKYEGAAFIGFRCAMDRVGSPVGLSKKKKK